MTKPIYPLFLKTDDSLTAIISPVRAYQYKETDHSQGKPKGFQYNQFTSRKTVRKLEGTGTRISELEFELFLETKIHEKLSLLRRVIQESICEF